MTIHVTPIPSTLTLSDATPDAVTPGGSGAVGSSELASRGDHDHPATAVGDFSGPGSSVDNALVRFHGTGGKTGQGYTSGDPVFSDVGELTFSANPAYLGRPAGNTGNETGDGTLYTVAFATEIYDQGGDFSDPTFTAPIAGRYLVTSYIQCGGLLASHTAAILQIVSSNRNYSISQFSPGALRDASGQATLHTAAIVDMDASDTMTITFTVSGGTKVVIIHGGSTAYTSLSISKVD